MHVLAKDHEKCLHVQFRPVFEGWGETKTKKKEKEIWKRKEKKRRHILSSFDVVQIVHSNPGQVGSSLIPS